MSNRTETTPTTPGRTIRRRTFIGQLAVGASLALGRVIPGSAKEQQEDQLDACSGYDATVLTCDGYGGGRYYYVTVDSSGCICWVNGAGGYQNCNPPGYCTWSTNGNLCFV